MANKNDIHLDNNCADGGSPSEDPSVSVMQSSEYLSVTYDPNKVPYTSYPRRFGAWLMKTVFQKTGRLLDVGCGRGEYLGVFADLGCEVAGVDISPSAPALAGDRFPVAVANLEMDAMPYPEGSFDFVFSKSVIEHVHNPVIVLTKIFAALKPGGIAVIMTPSWRHTYWGPFYIDHTHVTPFTAPSLEDALLLAGFKNVEVSHFYQLPLLWDYPILKIFAALLAFLPLPFRPLDKAPWPDAVNKTIRFSKEVMLLAVTHKPLDPVKGEQ